MSARYIRSVRLTRAYTQPDHIFNFPRKNSWSIFCISKKKKKPVSHEFLIKYFYPTIQNRQKKTPDRSSSPQQSEEKKKNETKPPAVAKNQRPSSKPRRVANVPKIRRVRGTEARVAARASCHIYPRSRRRRRYGFREAPWACIRSTSSS